MILTCLGYIGLVAVGALIGYDIRNAEVCHEPEPVKVKIAEKKSDWDTAQYMIEGR